MKKTTRIALALVTITLSTACSQKIGLLTTCNNFTKNTISRHTTIRPKKWLVTKIDNFTEKIRNRHTYQHRSFEHLRDMTLLFFLPASYSHSLLEQQRNNMLTFLDQNEKNALCRVKEYFNCDDKKWSHIMATLEKESDFVRNAMQSKGYHITRHDSSLPEPWVTALQKECARHSVRPENINFGTTMTPNIFAGTFVKRPKLHRYYPAKIDLNPIEYLKITQKRILQTAAHEAVHLIKNHALFCQIIENEIRNEELQRSFPSSAAYENLMAAIEKTADTCVACTDPEVAQNAVEAIQDGYGYPENYNDIRVINYNWKVTQAITNFQQQKNWLWQWLRAFPSFFA